MLHQVLCLCYTLPLVSVYGLAEVEDMSAFTKYASEQRCDNDTPFAEFKPWGILQCFSKCLQLASCTHIKYHPKKLICRTSKTLPTGKPVNSKSDQGWICWKKIRQVVCPECLQGTRCFKARSGQTKCVPYDVQEKQQKKVRMSKQLEKVTELFNTTPQGDDMLIKSSESDHPILLVAFYNKHGLRKTNSNPDLHGYGADELNGIWTTTKINSRGNIKSTTWSPLCSDDFYFLTYYTWLGNSIERYRLKGSTLERQSGQKPVDERTFIPNTIDTGRCLRDDSMNCIHIFGKIMRNQKYIYRVLHVSSYRVLNPSQLVEERQEDITQQVIPAPAFKECVFACKWKSGMGLYLPQGKRSAMKRYSIQADEGAFSLKESGEVEGLKDVLDIKWNYDGTFAIAMSTTTLYLINDKEQVIIEVQHKLNGVCGLVCTNTSILVLKKDKGFSFLHVLKF